MTQISSARVSRRRLLALGLGGAAAGLVRLPGRAAAAQATTVRATLPNGLLVIAEERRSAEVVAARLTARAGARDTADLPGLALLTSRLMFQGTARYPSETDLERAAILVGGTIDHDTRVERSFISTVVPSFEADVGFDLLSEIVINARLAEDALDRQKRIALQEVAQRRGSPSSLIQELYQSSLFAGHPLAAPVAGSQESIGAISRDAILGARERLWRANNLVLTVVGNIAPDEVLARAQRFFGPLPAGAKNQRQLMPLEPKNLPGTVRGEAGQQQIQFRVGFAAPAQRDRDSYPFMLLDSILSGSTGLIFRELRTERGLAYVAGSAYQAYQDAGTWFATAGVDPQNLEAALDVTQSVIRVVRDFRVRDEALVGIRGQIEAERALEDETNAARAERLEGQEVLGREPIDELVARLSEVTPADLQRVAREYLAPERALTAIVGPVRAG